MDYQIGMKMVAERNYLEHEHFFQDILEIARRHKIMNPEKMRTEYAKVTRFPFQDWSLPSTLKLFCRRLNG